MHLDDRRLEHEKRVKNGHRRMGVPGGINNQPGCLLATRFLNPVDNLTLMVRLTKFDGQTVPGRRRPAKLLDIG